MLLRRAAALFVLLTTFHLSVAAGDLACADHGSDAAASAMAMDMGGAHDVHAPAAEEAAPPCEVPVQQHCCEAVAGCGVAGILSATERETPRVRLVAQRIGEPTHHAPASFAPAPEPPPPKA